MYVYYLVHLGTRSIGGVRTEFTDELLKFKGLKVVHVTPYLQLFLPGRLSMGSKEAALLVSSGDDCTVFSLGSCLDELVGKGVTVKGFGPEKQPINKYFQEESPDMVVQIVRLICHRKDKQVRNVFVSCRNGGMYAPLLIVLVGIMCKAVQGCPCELYKDLGGRVEEYARSPGAAKKTMSWQLNSNASVTRTLVSDLIKLNRLIQDTPHAECDCLWTRWATVGAGNKYFRSAVINNLPTVERVLSRSRERGYRNSI